MQRLLRTLLLATALLAVPACGATPAPADTDIGGAAGTGGTAGAGGSGGTETTGAPVPLVTPDSLVIQPGGGRAFLLNAIAGATSTVRVVSYLLTDDEIEDALVVAKRRGVEVRAIVPFELDANDAARGKLTAAGIEVRDGNPAFALTHEKAVVVDDEQAFVLTQNLTFSGFEYNREYDLAITGTAAGDVSAIFDADWDRRTFTSETDLIVSPINSRTRLEALLRAATERIDVQMEVLNDSRVIDLLGARARSGIEVRVLLEDPADVEDNRTAAARLASSGAQVRWLGDPELHAKAIVVDGRYAYAGSINFTTASLDRNREVGLVTDDATTVARIADTLESDFARGSAF